MPTWLSAVLFALWKIVEPFVAPLIAAKVGADLQKGKQAEDTLEGILDASKAQAAARGWSDIDRVRYLERRGRVRGLSK